MKLFSTVAALGMIALSAQAFATDHQVKMVNKDSEGRAMQFEPAYLKVAPGDTVTFVNLDKGHNSESVKGMVPEGAETWKGKINEEVKVTFNVQGLYGYKCLPHQGTGMVGLIQVGDNATNLEGIKAVKMSGKAKARMDELLAQVSGS